MINNFKTIGKILDFSDSDRFYFIQIIQRGKDLPTHKTGESVKRVYSVSSAEDWEKVRPSIIRHCDFYKARAYIHPTTRSKKVIALHMLSALAERIEKGDFFNLNSLFPSCCGRYAKGDTLWIIDLDREGKVNFDGFVNTVKEVISKVKGSEGERVVLEVPTPNGLHLISRPFDIKEFNNVMYELGVDAPDIHKNNPTVLYVPDIWKTEIVSSPVNSPMGILEKWRKQFFADMNTEDIKDGFKVIYNNGVVAKLIFDNNGRSIYILFGGKFVFPEAININLPLVSINFEGEFIYRYNLIMKLFNLPLIKRKPVESSDFISCIRDMVEYYLGSISNEADRNNGEVVWFGRPFKDLYDLPNILLWIQVNDSRDIVVKYIDEKDISEQDISSLDIFIESKGIDSDSLEKYINWIYIKYDRELENEFVNALGKFFDEILTRYIRQPLKIKCHDILEWRQ